MAQVRRRTEAGVFGYALDADVAGLQMIARFAQPDIQKPLGRGHAGGLAEAAQEGAFAHAGAPGQVRDAMLLMQMLAHMIEQGAEAITFMAGRHAALDKLRLTAIPVRRHDKAARHGIGGGWTEIPTDQVQAQVDAGGAAGRGQDLTLVDIKHIGDDFDFGIGGLDQCVVARLPASRPLAART